MRHRLLWIVSVFTVAAFAASGHAAPVKIDVPGSGSAALACKPIRNICELQAIGKTVAAKAGSYCLANDIDARQIATCAGAVFQPIGSNTQPFTGKLDGQGFHIRNLSISKPSAPINAEIGLFGRIGETATVHNVGLIDATVTVIVNSGSQSSRSSVGGLAGTNFGVLRNVFVTGLVACTGSEWLFHERCDVGGLIGLNYGSIEAAFTMVHVRVGRGNHYLGGLVGANDGTIKAAHSTGPIECPAVTENFCTAGGLVGGNRGEVTVSFATGLVDIGNGTGSCGPYNNLCQAGGLLGEHTGFTDSPISQSFALGPVSCFGLTCVTGGLIARAEVGPIDRTYATGSVSCDTTMGNVCTAAGLIGMKLGTLSSSFAAGKIECKAGFICSVGGLVAFGAFDIDVSYWDTVSTKQSANGNYNEAIGLTTQELQSSLPPGFDPAFWSISPAESYPYLTVLNRWIPPVESTDRKFRARLTSFWGSLALAKTKYGLLAAFPAGQIFPWEYHAYDKRKVSTASKAAVYGMIARLIGIGKPAAEIKYRDGKSDPLSLAKIDYFMDEDDNARWPRLNPDIASEVKFYAGTTLVPNPRDRYAASFDHHDIISQIRRGRLVMIQDSSGDQTHWMLATAVKRSGAGKVTGIVANDPLLGQVIIDMVPSSPTYRRVTEPTNYRSLSSSTFFANDYFSVALN